MTTRRRAPPVIPEIAKAYQNDPRTLMAVQAMNTGSSTAPTATGKYAVADGAARALQGMMGAYMNNKQMGQYGEDQDTLLAQRKARGVDALNATAAPTLPAAPPPPPVAPPVAPQGVNPQAAAAALGAPPPAPPGPMQGAPPPIPAPQPNPVQGGGPVRRPPFGPSPAQAGGSWNAPPQLEQVPDAPAPIARPNAPEAVAPTRSKLLDAAYKIMVDANPYESASGQDAYMAGLSDQDKLNESAAERRQRLIDMGYQADLGTFADAQSQDRSNAYGERRDVQGRNFQAGESFKQRGFQAHEGAADRSAAMARERYSAGAQASLQRSSQAFQQAQSDRDFEHQKVLKGMDVRVTGRNGAAAYLNTKAGRADFKETAKVVGTVSNQLAILNAFEATLNRTKTGGVLLGNAPGLVKWSNSDLQKLDSYTQNLVANNAKLLPGALSDKEGARLEAMGPSIKKTPAANREQLNFLRGVAVRQRAFAMGQQRALQSGEGLEYLDKWTAYTNSVPVTSPISYDQWITKVPKYDAAGNMVKQ